VPPQICQLSTDLGYLLAPTPSGQRVSVCESLSSCNRELRVLVQGRETLIYMIGYDVIGDVHGCADLLEGLLGELGYQEEGGAYRYVGSGGDRQAVFVGDLIDRGSQQIKTLEVVRSMVDAGSAQIVMGNHEFNAISFATPSPVVPGEFMRRRTPKNCKQHKAFTDQIPTNTKFYRGWIDWFKTLPLWLGSGVCSGIWMTDPGDGCTIAVCGRRCRLSTRFTVC
jgi:hypothetical protein